MAGLNGDNETAIGKSNSISLSFYNPNKNQLEINFVKPAKFVIQKNIQLLSSFVNYDSNKTMQMVKNKSSTSKLFYQSFELSGSSVSIHFQIKPENVFVSYVALLKYGSVPTFEDFNYDYMKIFCTTG